MRKLMRVGWMVLLTLGWTLRASARNPSATGSSESADHGQETAKTNGRGAIGAICESQSNGSCRIRSVVKGGPADQAGLRGGDVLLRLEDKNSGAVTEQIAKTKPGTRTNLEFQRGGERKQVPVVVADEVALYSRAAEAGDHTAQTILGEIYVWGAPKNVMSGMNWLRKAAEAGEPAAETDLATIYLNGRVVSRDDNAAVSWFRKAAERSDPNGQYSLGFMYAEGRGVAKDPKAALDWYSKAAEQVHASSQWSVGWFYEQGIV